MPCPYGTTNKVAYGTIYILQTEKCYSFAMLKDNYSKQQATTPVERLAGSIERITFHSEESGFCVLRVKVKSQRDVVTVIGNAVTIAPGEYIECLGFWINDKTHGLQFKTTELKTVRPSTIEGITKYLASGMVKGIGPHFAKQLVKTFGEAVFEIIEQTPNRLREVPGIGEKRYTQIISAWAEQKVIRDIMVFLQSHCVGTARAVRIYKTYGEQAILRVQENPYRLALDIHGIGFKTADAVAERLGIARDSTLRAAAGVRHVLQELCEAGHCAVEIETLVAASVKLLEIAEPIIRQALEDEIHSDHVVQETIGEKDCIFPVNLYQAEVGVMQHLLRLREGELPWGNIATDKAIQWVEEKTHLQLSASQQQALATMLQNKVTIITGGPGVGKTTVVNSILQIVRAKRCNVALCAPTGRAAKRLTETTSCPAKTIHRLLEFNAKTFNFRYQQDYPLPIDFLIVDEASMLDVVLMYHLLKAIPSHAALLLVGDVDQLPSVGPGAVLADIINSNVIATLRLTEIFRQAATSKIIINAHRINQGYMPSDNQEGSDFYTIYTDTSEDIHDKLLQVVTKRIPERFSFDPLTDIQVLTPMNRGGLGARSLNIILQTALNGQAEPKITRFGWTFAPGDKVIQMVNNYDKDVFNGDVGIIRQIDLEESTLTIFFDGRPVEYDFNELDEVSLAYAISIHKSQGSEYPAVVIPIATQHYTLLARNLLYTAVTRGKKLVVLVGQKKAVGIAVHNVESKHRLTKLSERLKDALLLINS